MEVCLEPGDFLYLPGGWGSEAFTGACSSLHLSVGVSLYTWGDLLAALLSSLRQENIDFRRALPAGFLNEGTINSEQMERLLQVIAEQTDLDSAIKVLKNKLLARTSNPLPNDDFQRLDSANVKAALARQIQSE
jgi:ribosomal protein L16 Arg81 hydroxylase